MKHRIAIQNLKCGGCSATIVKNLEALSGISNVEVDLDASEVGFSASSPNGILEVEKRLAQLGYPPEGTGNGLGSKTKSVVSCLVGRFS